jgi:flagellar biosynthesis protein FlhF
VEQWRRYAELIGFPFDVATNPGTFHRVAHNHTEDILLIDTAGRAIGEQHDTLAGCVAGLRDMSHEVLLVLPAWLRGRDAERAVSTYAAPKITGVVITKLDETDQVGGVMHASIGCDLPVSYLCNGARVPEDIHDAVVDQVLDAIFPEQA